MYICVCKYTYSAYVNTHTYLSSGQHNVRSPFGKRSILVVESWCGGLLGVSTIG